MFDYKKYFNTYCKENLLDLRLSFDMPLGYESANGMFDVKTKTIFINEAALCDIPDCEKLFYLFHELRHASQYLCPQNFSEIIVKSSQYSIMYDGTCYKLVNGKYYNCKLKGDEEYFINLYLGQPYELDANTFAYEQVKKIYGESEKLKQLFDFWSPRSFISRETYNGIYAVIDSKTAELL